MLVEFLEHRAHRAEGREPFPDRKEIVDPHPDYEYRERLVHPRRVPTVYYLRHPTPVRVEEVLMQ